MPEFGPGKTFATITFGVVYFVSPFGNPAGYEKPAGLKNGFVWSIPSSTTAIFMPVPSAPLVCRSTSAPMIDGERSSASVYATLGYTRVIEGWRTSAGSFAAGSEMVSASRITRKRRPMRACGIARRSAAATRFCCSSIRRRYARVVEEAKSSLLRVPATYRLRPNCAASGGSGRSAITRNRPDGLDSGMTPARTRGSVRSPSVRCTGTGWAAAGRTVTSAAEQARSGTTRRNDGEASGHARPSG